MKKADIEKQESIDKVKEWLKPGDTVYCILRHVSRSGMMRRISFMARPDDDFRYLDYHIEKILGYKRDGDGVKVQGCGMDMGFSVVYNLGATLWPNGTEKPHGTRNGEPDSNGGYALKHRWI